MAIGLQADGSTTAMAGGEIEIPGVTIFVRQRNSSMTKIVMLLSVMWMGYYAGKENSPHLC